MIFFSLNKYKQNCVVYIWYYSLGISTGLGIIFLCPRRVSPFLAWVIFTRARVSLALSIPEEKWGLLVVYDRVDSW